MKKLPALFLALLSAALLFAGCNLGGLPDNIPYEPDTPAPDPHDGVFVSEHGSMTFFGDGERLAYDFDEFLAEQTGLPAGEQEGSYVFLSGNLPPHGSLPVRYDTAHELQITVGETTVVIDVGVAAEDGKTATVGVGIVTPESIPLLFRGDSFFTVMFQAEN